MTPPLRIVFVNRFYWPDSPATAQLLTDLAEGLANQGWPVTILARRPNASVPETEVHRGVQIRRIRTSAWGRRSLTGRALDFSTFILGVRRQLRTQLETQDVLVTMTDPPLLGPAVGTVVRQRGAHWVHWTQDIFPEVASAVSRLGFLNTLIPWRDRAWRAADHCVVPGTDMAEVLRRHGVRSGRITVSENWAPVGLRPAESAAWRQRQGLADRFVVMYSGNLGRVHDFSAIVPLARALGPNSGIRFVFVGDGAQRAKLEERVRAEGLEHVSFLPAQPRDELPAVLSAGDLHLITLRAGCENLVFPSKLYGIAAVGRPALVIGPRGCEPSRVVTTHGFGTGHTPDEIPGMVEFIRRLQVDASFTATLGQAALQFSQRHGQFDRALASWSRVLTSLIRLAPTASSTTSSLSAP